jgi:hypothetical protein
MGAPACISSAVSVGATDDLDVVASFSNHAAFLSLLAPGVGIASAVPFDLFGFSYGVSNGTSMAAPHVAGAWAALRQAAPGASVSTLLAALQSTGLSVSGPGAVVVPRIDLAAALEVLAPACSGPDDDGDGVPDACDNCILEPNADQADVNDDGYGDLCDPDFNDDGLVGVADFNFIRNQFGLACGDPGFEPVADMRSDCRVGIDDFNRLKRFFSGPPAPRAPRASRPLSRAPAPGLVARASLRLPHGLPVRFPRGVLFAPAPRYYNTGPRDSLEAASWPTPPTTWETRATTTARRTAPASTHF